MRREPLFSAKKCFPDPPQKTPGVSAPVGRRRLTKNLQMMDDVGTNQIIIEKAISTV
jgi:hypothetical protein